MTKSNQHVVPHGNDWAVRGEGNSRVTSIHPTQPHFRKKTNSNQYEVRIDLHYRFTGEFIAKALGAPTQDCVT